MKKFSNYQYVGGEMSERDKKEAGSKFWNKGKWDNFVLPFLPEDCKGMTLIDMGCNAGLFLKLAEDKGFSKVIGIDADKEVIRKAIAYRERNGGTYDIQRRRMERSINKLPIADFTILANAHYYFAINDWLDYLDKLQTKTRYCIIVTAKKKSVRCKASADPKVIRDYFKSWDEVGDMIEPSPEGDPFPRRLCGLCFKSRLIEKVPIDSLNNGNNQQTGFWKQLDKGVKPIDTQYHRRLKSYRKKKWPKDRMLRCIQNKAVLYENIKRNGMIIVGSKNRIGDGNHRHDIMRHLGHKSIFIRRVL